MEKFYLGICPSELIEGGVFPPRQLRSDIDMTLFFFFFPGPVEIAVAVVFFPVMYTPKKLTWNPNMEVWKMMFLFNWVIFRFHVNFQGCSYIPFPIGYAFGRVDV